MAGALEGKVVAITGASSGIGEATAVAVARRGATVLLLARRTEELLRVQQQILDDGGEAYVYPCDLTDGPAVEETVAKMLAAYGAVDYLVNDAGRSIRRSMSLTYDRFHDFERMMAVNYFGAVRLTMGLLPAMVEQRSGHVVNVTSWGVQAKLPKFGAYLPSKTALDTWARIAGRETYADGVTFSNVRFGLVLTPMVMANGVTAGRRALTAEQAGERVVRALEDRPLTMGTAAGRSFELLNLVAPRFSDAVAHRMHRKAPDSAAARGQVSPGSVPSP
jgi:NAD(P)-dependent dehydrogenase (short-subunit alcohol dehydrogenase family)